MVKSVALALVVVINIAIGVRSALYPQPVTESGQDFAYLIAVGLIIVHVLTVVVILARDWERLYIDQFNQRLREYERRLQQQTEPQ
jgi:uncharacterized membrane protein YcjF (UPF0283 family)